MKLINSINKISRLHLTYYTLAILLGLYSLLVKFLYSRPLGERVATGNINSSLTLYVIIPVFLILVAMSILIIISTLKNKQPKLNLIYPIYFLVLWIITPIFGYVVIWSLPTTVAYSILDVEEKIFVAFYLFDIFFPIYVLNRLRGKK